MKFVAAIFALLCAAPAVAQSPLKDLKLEIPSTKYVLKNGLTLIVNEDRKAPIVAVQIWYKVGSRDEPPGRSGFAHLFEHLMFNGSEHADTDWFKPVQALGATGINGSTSNDRTNYYQVVPKGALDSILWLESDRMGHFLGAVTEAKLVEQRGVVQNEKRQRENRPYGLAEEITAKATYPAGHPYQHSTIGSMADLDAAKLEDVKQWFRDWYGPANAILVLSGDISAPEALAKVERAFGDIPPGPPVTRADVWIAKRTGEQREVAQDMVAQPRLTKVWNVPEREARDTVLLDLAGGALTDGRSSRLYKRLVHDEQVATGVYAYIEGGEIAGQFTLIVDMKPDADVTKVEAAVDEELARLLAQGPTQSELDLARTAMAGATARRLESVAGKASMLVRAESQHGDPNAWRRAYDIAMAATRQDVQAAAQRWLSDGQYVLTILPRPAYAASGTGLDRKTMPTPTPTAPQGLPSFERATLANGLKLIVASRREAPIVELSLNLETGYTDEEAALPAGAAGMTVGLLDEGTTTRTGVQISDELRRLGADMSVSGDGERASVSISTLSATLDGSLALFADVALHPAFRTEDLERVRQQAIVGVDEQRRDPASAANRLVRPLVFGADHPYGRLTTEASLKAFAREQAVAYHKRWFTPGNATLIVVGDTTMAEIRPKIEKAFAGWSGAATARKAVPDAPAAKPGLYLIDRPGAAQSYVIAATPGPRWSAEDEVALTLMNTAFGGNFTARLNMNLREDKHWSYGVRSGLAGRGRGPQVYRMTAPVQTDKTADSIRELTREYTDVATSRPITPAELARVKSEMILAMPGQWESLSSVGSAIGEIVYHQLPDDYWTRYAAQVEATTSAALTAAAAKVVRPQDVMWVVVGDRARIEADLKKFELGPVKVIDADGKILE